jgi:hypothetical protein
MNGNDTQAMVEGLQFKWYHVLLRYHVFNVLEIS